MASEIVKAINPKLVAERVFPLLTNAQYTGHNLSRIFEFQNILFLLFFVLYATPQVFAGSYYSMEEKTTSAFETASPLIASATDEIPNITVRFANPQYDCDSEQYCLDIEFQSDIPDQELFGMNVRFFYDDAELEIIDFSDFQGGYGPSGGNPGTVITSGPGFGSSYFNFPAPGAVDFINFAFELADGNAPPIYIGTSGWTKLLQVCFTVDGPVPDSSNFCPPVVWDLRVDPTEGGYLAGDNGVVITVVAPDPNDPNLPSFEHVEQFNWEYIGDGSNPPYGQPVELNCISLLCGPYITCPADIEINCDDSTLPENTGYATSVGGCQESPALTYSDSLVTGTCGAGSFIYRQWMVMDSCGSGDTCQQVISIDDRGKICGVTFNDRGEPMGGIQLSLFADLNESESLDAGDTLVAITLSDSISGGYCFDSMLTCAYIITELQPQDYGDLFDYDFTPDPDGKDSIDGPDNEIPVFLMPCEIDSNNNFIDIVCPSLIPLVPADTICENDITIFEIEDLDIGLVTYNWNFGSGSEPATGSGLGPHEVSYISTNENQEGGAIVELTIGKAGCPDTTAEVSIIQVNEYPDASIDADTDIGCYFTERVFQPLQPEIPGADYAWNFGIGAVPQTASGYGPHDVYYQISGSKTVSLVIHPNEAGAQCPDSSTVTFNIINCPSNIVGSVKSTTNEPIADVNIRLYVDNNTDGIADNNSAVRSVYTAEDGGYSMASLTPGNYVIVETQPSGWNSFDDGDDTPDNDIVDNIDSLDNLIPVSLVPLEVDQVNTFTEIAIQGMIAGYVFVDMDEDQVPDDGEGLSSIAVSLFHDANTDGIADDNIPIETQFTTSDGSYIFPNVLVGNYVIAETQPEGYVSVIDIDVSSDGDAVPNTNMMNDTIPVSITNGELDFGNYFIDADSCGIIVTNTNDEGAGSLRHAIECASSGDTITFHASLAGATIEINSSRILLEKDLVVYSTLSPRVNLSSHINGFFDITSGTTVEFRQLNIISGLTGNLGAAFKNIGILKLNDVNVIRNALLPPEDYLIYNSPMSELILIGDCLLEAD